jgi:predicted MPP superfamily phosphohydrolase
LSTHLIIPDSHAHPDHSNERYDYIGHLINDLKPDVVVDIGDFWDMSSLCSYDKGLKSFEGRRYKRDVAAGIEAQDRIATIVKRQKKRLPRFVRTLGNHENRISRAVERDPILEGTIGLDDLQSKEYGWEQYSFLQPVEIDGVTYQHYFITGVSGRPIGGERHAASLLAKNFRSSTCGHSHLFDYCVRTDISGNSLHGLVVGVYQDYDADFAGPANGLWNAGVSVCRNVENGNYDLQHISLKALAKEYGKSN